MSKEILNYTEIEDDQENYVGLFEQYTIKVSPYQLTLRDKGIFVLGFIVLTAIGIGILTEEPPQKTKDYILFGLFSLMYIGIFGGLAWHVFKPHPDYYLDDQGFKATLRGKLVPWQNVKDIAFDFLGMKIIEKSGKKHRIFIHDVDNQYRMNVFLTDLVWAHTKYSMTTGSLIRNLLGHLERGMEFGKEQAIKLRQREIHFYLSILGLTLLGAFLAAAFIWYFIWLEEGELTLSAKKTIAVFIIAIAIDLFFLLRAITNDVHKHAQNIRADSKGLDITYADGRKQVVTWQEMLELWDDPDYGKDGKYAFEIWHSTDGGMLLIHLLPYAAEYFTNEEMKDMSL